MIECSNKLVELAEIVVDYHETIGFKDFEYQTIQIYADSINWLIDRWEEGSCKDKIVGEVRRLEEYIMGIIDL